MNILVATDGSLNSENAADAVERWYEDGDTVIIFTALNVPTEFLRGLEKSGVAAAAEIALEAGQTLGAGDRAAERLAGTVPPRPKSPDGSPVLRAMATTASARTKPVVDALKNRGIDASATWRTTESKTANTILSKVKDAETDLLIIGSHGRGQYEGLLGSTGTKLVRLAPASVLVIRNRTAKPGQSLD